MPETTDDLGKAARAAARDFESLFRKHWPVLRETAREELPRVRETVRREAPRFAAIVRTEIRRAAAELRRRGR